MCVVSLILQPMMIQTADLAKTQSTSVTTVEIMIDTTYGQAPQALPAPRAFQIATHRNVCPPPPPPTPPPLQPQPPPPPPPPPSGLCVLLVPLHRARRCYSSSWKNLLDRPSCYISRGREGLPPPQRCAIVFVWMGSLARGVRLDYKPLQGGLARSPWGLGFRVQGSGVARMCLGLAASPLWLAGFVS
jgi:hypothetical protein